MKKKCEICKKNVKETVHTSTNYKVDYYTIWKNEKQIDICAECFKKKIAAIA